MAWPHKLPDINPFSLSGDIKYDIKKKNDQETYNYNLYREKVSKKLCYKLYVDPEFDAS